MNKKEVKLFLLEKSGYMAWSSERIAAYTNSKLSDVKDAINEIKQNKATRDALIGKPTPTSTEYRSSVVAISKEEYDAFKAYQEFTKELEAVKVEVSSRTKGLVPYEGNPDNVLIIGDLHEPFCLDSYLEFCRIIQEKYDCGTVIFIGDLVDNHFASFHTSELDTYGPNQEFDYALARIQEWYSIFPKATVVLGNHDRIIQRKAKVAGIADRWFKELPDALKTPNWEYVESVVIDGVNYNHGEGGTASTRMKNELQSQVQGHLHSEAYVQYACGSNFKVFGMQVGCGVNRKSFAFAYGKDYKKPMISCGVVLEKGTLPLVIPANL